MVPRVMNQWPGDVHHFSDEMRNFQHHILTVDTVIYHGSCRKKNSAQKAWVCNHHPMAVKQVSFTTWDGTEPVQYPLAFGQNYQHFTLLKVPITMSFKHQKHYWC